MKMHSKLLVAILLAYLSLDGILASAASVLFTLDGGVKPANLFETFSVTADLNGQTAQIDSDCYDEIAVALYCDPDSPQYDPTLDCCSCSLPFGDSRITALTCGDSYVLTVSGYTCSPGANVTFTVPAGYLLEIKDQQNNTVFDKNSIVGISLAGGTKYWTVTLKPKRIHFSEESLPSDGRSQVQAKLNFLTGSSGNYFTGSPVWTIQGDKLGCTIDQSTGWIRAGTETGEITVWATDSGAGNKFVSGSLPIGCEPCSVASCGIGQGIVGNLRNALAVKLGLLPCDGSSMGSIRLKLM